MSIENARNLYQRMTTEEAFRTQLQSAASEERIAIIQKVGYDFTADRIQWLGS